MGVPTAARYERQYPRSPAGSPERIAMEGLSIIFSYRSIWTLWLLTGPSELVQCKGIVELVARARITLLGRLQYNCCLSTDPTQTKTLHQSHRFPFLILLM